MYETERHPTVLERDDKVLIVMRPLFIGDADRHFVGTVERYDPGVIRVRGYAFLYDKGTCRLMKQKSQRTRIFAVDNHLIIFVLPSDTDIGTVHYESSEENGLTATDGTWTQAGSVNCATGTGRALYCFQQQP